MTATRSLPASHRVAAHEHGWTTESLHRTSEGSVRYVRCATCGARRVDLVRAAAVVPEPASAVVAATASDTVG